MPPQLGARPVAPARVNGSTKSSFLAWASSLVLGGRGKSCQRTEPRTRSGRWGRALDVESSIPDLAAHRWQRTARERGGKQPPAPARDTSVVGAWLSPVKSAAYRPPLRWWLARHASRFGSSSATTRWRYSSSGCHEMGRCAIRTPPARRRVRPVVVPAASRRTAPHGPGARSPRGQPLPSSAQEPPADQDQAALPDIRWLGISSARPRAPRRPTPSIRWKTDAGTLGKTVTRRRAACRHRRRELVDTDVEEGD